MKYSNIPDPQSNFDLNIATMNLLINRGDNLKKYTRCPAFWYSAHADSDIFSEIYDTAPNPHYNHSIGIIGHTVYHQRFNNIIGIGQLNWTGTQAISVRIMLSGQNTGNKLEIESDILSAPGEFTLGPLVGNLESELAGFADDEIISITVFFDFDKSDVGTVTLRSLCLSWEHSEDSVYSYTHPENIFFNGDQAHHGHNSLIASKSNLSRLQNRKKIGKYNRLMAAGKPPGITYPTTFGNMDNGFRIDLPNDLDSGTVEVYHYFYMDGLFDGTLEDFTTIHSNSAGATHESKAIDDFDFLGATQLDSEKIVIRKQILTVYPDYQLETEIRDNPQSAQWLSLAWGTLTTGPNSAGSLYYAGSTAFFLNEVESRTTNILEKENILVPISQINSEYTWQFLNKVKTAQDYLKQYESDRLQFSQDVRISEVLAVGESVFDGNIYVPVGYHRKIQDKIFLWVSGYTDNSSPSAGSELKIYYSMTSTTSWIHAGTVYPTTGFAWWGETIEVQNIPEDEKFIKLKIESNYNAGYTLQAISVNYDFFNKFTEIK